MRFTSDLTLLHLRNSRVKLNLGQRLGDKLLIYLFQFIFQKHIHCQLPILHILKSLALIQHARKLNYKRPCHFRGSQSDPDELCQMRRLNVKATNCLHGQSSFLRVFDSCD